MAASRDTHLPASEADRSLPNEEREKGEDVGKPASEADEPAAPPREDDLGEGRPGRGGPGSFPPPD